MSKILVILGMHRSGTSLLANLIHESGIPLGESLMPPTQLNPKGYFEDMEIYTLHDNILRQSNLPYTVTEKDEISVSENHLSSIKEIIQKRSVKDQWGWKEPRTCLFLDNWHKIMLEEGHEPYYVISYRPLEQVVDSLVRRDIVEIKMIKNIFIRWRELRRYNKGLRDRQFHYMESWRHHLTKLMEFHQNNKEKTAVLYSTNIATDFPKLKNKLHESWGFNIKDINFNAIFSKDLFTSLPEIQQYSDKNIQTLQNYFQENQLS